MIPYFVKITLVIFNILNIIGLLLSYLIIKNKKIQKYRIQKTDLTKVSNKRMNTILLNAFIFEPILLVIGLTATKHLFVPHYTIISVIIQLIMIFIIDDLWVYVFHRLFHSNKYVYKIIHSTHHIATSPIPMDMHYFSIYEMIIISSGFFVASMLIGNISYVTLWSFMVMKMCHEFDIHSGIKIYKSLPFIVSVEDHDNHHLMIKGNYASTLKLYDYLFTTQMK